MNLLDDSNEAFRLAVDLVNQSNRNIFLTGKAGTGKTTFLRYIREHCLKQAAVVAPTGVAAINAGGSTIHSFFQLPFSPYLPGPGSAMQDGEANNRHTLFGKIKLNRERIKVIQQLELLIIDEISMVRCDLLDSIDAVLRHFRHRNAEPFGGVQVLLIGDMYQLPPVVANGEWNLLSQFYSSPYFFDSRIIQSAPPVYVEFEKIYRQTDHRFIELLNEVRNNRLSAEGKQMLDSLYQPGLAPRGEDGTIILTTHNYKADAINEAEIAKLDEKLYSFKAAVEGEFNEKAYPADELLRLKQGAQVMFIKNDRERARRYYNGKIGVVARVTDDSIFVQCKDEAEEIEVKKETWENIRYSINKRTNQLEEDVAGSFTQFPLRLAWAITIHKSQGLTFEKAVIDAGDAFAAGQVYVALSRCTSIDGIVLQSRVTPSSLRVDDTIVQFSSRQGTTQALRDELQRSRKGYQENILLQVFDLSLVLANAKQLQKLIEAQTKDFNDAAITWINNLIKSIDELQDVCARFKTRLHHYFLDPSLPEENPALQSRVAEAASYFTKALRGLTQNITSCDAVTESKIQAKNFNEQLKDIATGVAEKQYIIEGFSDGFSIERYYAQKRSFTVPAFAINVYATAAEEKSESPHPALHYQLRQIRNKICEQKNAPIYMVANGKTIDEMAMYLPQTLEELAGITGFGKSKANQYGQSFLEIIVAYCAEHGFESLMHRKTTKKERKKKSITNKKADSKSVTLELFQQGKTIQEIADERKLAVSTIESHLAYYVEHGIIPVERFVHQDKLTLIEPLIDLELNGSLGSLKEKLGEDITYSELRMAVASMRWKRSKQMETLTG